MEWIKCSDRMPNKDMVLFWSENIGMCKYHKEIVMLEINKVYLGDCLELMKDIDDKSIDMILCDLPYGITACKWDFVIEFDKLWFHYKRIIKDRGAMVFTASPPFSSMLIMSNLKEFRHEWIYTKPNGTNFLQYKRSPAKIHESVLVFSKLSPNYYPLMELGKPYRTSGDGKKMDNITKYFKGRIATNNISGLRYPKSIINTKYQKSDRGLHSTQKPLQLFEYLIKTYSKEGDLVLDNCAGSGTTAIAAINTNRNYILMEKEEKYYDICNKRIADLKDYV